MVKLFFKQLKQQTANGGEEDAIDSGEILFNLSWEQRVWPLNGWNETESGVGFFRISLTTRDNFLFPSHIFFHLSCIIVCKKRAFLSIDQVFGVYVWKGTGWTKKNQTKDSRHELLFCFERRNFLLEGFVWELFFFSLLWVNEKLASFNVSASGEVRFVKNAALKKLLVYILLVQNLRFI